MLWREAWTAGLGGAIAGSLAIAGTGASPVRRIDASVSVAKTLVPIVQMAVAPPLVIADARELTEAGSDPCAELARIESLILRDARDESRVLGWGVHLLPLAANVAIAIALGTFLEDNWTPALLGLGAGLTVNELRMWSQPRGLRGALDRYRAGNLDEPRREASWILAPSLVRGSVRLTLLVPF